MDATSGGQGDQHDLAEIQRALEPLVRIPSQAGGTPHIRVDRKSLTDRRSHDDRFLLRFFAGCIFAIGLATMIPAIYQWLELRQSEEPMPVPRWIYLLGFLGATHLLYAVLTAQILDYSALQSLAVFLLVVTCLYGFAGVALILGDTNGSLARFLELPSVLRPRAATWCGVMFGVSALACYIFGREAVIMRRRVVGPQV